MAAQQALNGIPTQQSAGRFRAASPGPDDGQMKMRREDGMGGGGVLSASEVDEYRRQHDIRVNGHDVPAPFTTFEAGNFPPEIMAEFRRAGFPAPTPIQAQSWPVAMQGRDVVAIAKTGSGKTLGYLLPGMMNISRVRNDPRNGPTVLVLAPTRELATQIQDEAVKFGRSSHLSITCVYGGAPKGPQLRDIERGCDIVIATPGRLNDFLESRKIQLRQVAYLVLDEADRMLDMGFEPQIRKIVQQIQSRRQTLMYTATWPKEVINIARDLLYEPVQVNIGNTNELAANKAITQIVEVLQPYDKERRLVAILRTLERGAKVIIFCSTKRMCDQLSRSLMREFGAAAIHGDKSQQERDSVLAQFRSGRTPVLVATDVAARGLDIKDVMCVINYDFPNGVEDYVHRIGRTGRAGASGMAHTLFTAQDGKYARELIKVLEGANQQVPPELRGLQGMGGGGGRNRWGGSAGGGGYGGRGSFGGPSPAPYRDAHMGSGDRYGAPQYRALSPQRGRDVDRGRDYGGDRDRSRSSDRYRRRSLSPSPQDRKLCR
eukprot:TRINITY_DN862_c0_g2_i1.p1 TRINITY_DN862_c0_g2~~TRINITY_DN862_c0_g2_i1.p1  ORF type:complete len:626 (+),score=125.81 TRINITY_DN862_c0_g2_i1:242-1879(+)